MRNSNFSKALSAVDWDFRNVSNEGLCGFHWYPATFVSAIPGTIIPILSKPGDLVLDPFCGTATSGVEALRLGRRFRGIDTNPIAIMIARARLSIIQPNRLLSACEELTEARLKTPKATSHPNEPELLRWYHPETFRELNSILWWIRSLPSDYLRIPAQAIFSSILKQASSQSRHWGWVCDNVRPKANEVTYKDAINIYVRAIESFCNDSEHLFADAQQRIGAISRKELRQRAHLQCEDANSAISHMEPGSVDMVVTSPPYLGVADYVKSQRLSYLWFSEDVLSVEGFGSASFESLRRRELGARSYRHAANSFETYVQYFGAFFVRVREVLKKDGYIAIAIGQSSARANTIPAMLDAAKAASLHVMFQTNRAILPTKRRLMAKVPNEDLIIFSH